MCANTGGDHRRRPKMASGLSSPVSTVFGVAALALTGCGASLSPSVPLFGAYFPSWLICTAGGVVGAIVIRAAFVKVGLDEALPLRLLVYTCLAGGIGLVLALTVYGR